jgi:hypothetical protein
MGIDGAIDLVLLKDVVGNTDFDPLDLPDGATKRDAVTDINVDGATERDSIFETDRTTDRELVTETVGNTDLDKLDFKD